MHDISIFGTSSDAGKSTLAFAITYLLHHEGIAVAPFKAQNVSNNSKVCDSGGEIAEAQYFAANAINLSITPDMNPVLLKSGKGKSASLIINGQSCGEKSVMDYYADIGSLKPLVKEAFLRLKKKYACIVAEGAGSPVELNLMDRDLSNIFIASEFQTKIVLVADIERGGVFASIWGVYNLLPEALRANVVGVIVNKFRGDMKLFDEGVAIIEKEFKIPVLGVVPFRSFNLGFEDSQSLFNYTQDSKNAIIKVGVIALPHMSNFTDFEPLIADTEVDMRFVSSVHEADSCDVLVIPGSKRTLHDLSWLRDQGFEHFVKEKEPTLVAICGGYQMMFETIIDMDAVETDKALTVEGFGLLNGSIVFQKEKIVAKGKYDIFDLEVEGYEIHHGVTEALFSEKDGFYGTFVHGLFDSDAFRKKIFSKINSHYQGFDFKKHKKDEIKSFAQHVGEHMDIKQLIAAVSC